MTTNERIAEKIGWYPKLTKNDEGETVKEEMPDFINDDKTMAMLVEGLPKVSRTYFEWDGNEEKWTCNILPDYVLGPTYQNCWGQADTPHAALIAAIEEWMKTEGE